MYSLAGGSFGSLMSLMFMCVCSVSSLRWSRCFSEGGPHINLDILLLAYQHPPPSFTRPLFHFTHAVRN